MKRIRLGTLALFLLLAGCEQGVPPVAKVTPSDGTEYSNLDLVVAETRLGPITVADLDDYILHNSSVARFDPARDHSQQLKDITRRVAINRLLLDEATLVGADQEPGFRAQERRARRDLMSSDYLNVLPEAEPVAEEEVRERYEQNLDGYQREEQRQVFNIYKRYGPEGNREKTVTLLADLHRRLVNGENFELLARQHSDSDTRHQGGLVGTIGRGQFTADFDRVIFALEERKPSEPIPTADGVHLFLVRDIVEERNLSFEDVAVPLRLEIESERAMERLHAAAEALPQPEPRFSPRPEELAQILRLGDSATVILRLGEFALTVGQFREILETEKRRLGPRPAADLPFRLLDEIHNREIIYQYLESRGLGEFPLDALQRQLDRQLVEYLARRKLSAWVERSPEVLKSHYENNRMRFASPLRVRLRRLLVPVGSQGPAQMSALEAARRGLDAGDLALEDLADRHGGEVKDLGFASAAQVQSFAPRALRFVFLLKPGEHTPPYHRGGNLLMFQVTERQDPTPRPLALVREEVLQDYLSHYSADVFEQLGDELLREGGFRIFEEKLASGLRFGGLDLQ